MAVKITLGQYKILLAPPPLTLARSLFALAL
jgi:hypothetical protein